MTSPGARGGERLSGEDRRGHPAPPFGLGFTNQSKASEGGQPSG
jgi:hypothetical protein